MLLALFFALLISNSFAIQTKNDACSLLSICDNIAELRSQVADIREEQERQANIIEGFSLSKTALKPIREPKALTGKNNDESCTLQSICSNLAALSSELAAVQAEQERQADRLEDSCQTNTNPHPANCYEALKDAQMSDVTEIRVPEYSENSFEVACDQVRHRGGWTIILRRTDGSEDFFREWKDYEEGFGQVNGEHFVGLAKLHALTSSVRQELLVIIEDEAGERFEIFDNFRVGGAAINYTLESIGSFYGTASEALKYHVGMQFSTKDRDNDRSTNMNCAVYWKGAWWYDSCFHSNLASVYDRYRPGPLRWHNPQFNKPIKTAIMMIRPKE